MDNSVESLERLLELIDLPRFRKNLRHVLFSYLMHNHEELMPDFEWFIEDMDFFFSLLDELESNGVKSA